MNGARNDDETVFDGVRLGGPAVRALTGAGYGTFADLPNRLDELLVLHGVGPVTVRRLRAARSNS